MRDQLIRRDTPIPRGTRLAYRVVLDYPVEVDEYFGDDETITIDELEARVKVLGRLVRFPSVWKALALFDDSPDMAGLPTWWPEDGNARFAQEWEMLDRSRSYPIIPADRFVDLDAHNEQVAS